MLYLRWGLILLAFIVVGLFFYFPLDITMKSDNAYFKKAKACFDSGDDFGTTQALAAWFKDGNGRKDPRYFALAAEISRRNNVSETLDYNLNRTAGLVLAGGM